MTIPFETGIPSLLKEKGFDEPYGFIRTLALTKK